MAQHDYSANQALSLLLKRIGESSPDLASSLQAAIDIGKDVWESGNPVGTRRPRKYRKAVRLEEEEALRVVIRALQAHFVEQPLLITSAINDLSVAILGGSTTLDRQAPFDEWSSLDTTDTPIERNLEIELRTETQVLPDREDTVQLSSIDKEMIEGQKANIELLSTLTKFDSQ